MKRGTCAVLVPESLTLPRFCAFGIVLLLFTALVAGAQSSAPGQPVTATVDVSRTGPPVSPYIYGQFLEHGGLLMYNGLWSEMMQ
jgi:alpha-N-arabinofuranosidase